MFQLKFYYFSSSDSSEVYFKTGMDGFPKFDCYRGKFFDGGDMHMSVFFLGWRWSVLTGPEQILSTSRNRFINFS